MKSGCDTVTCMWALPADYHKNKHSTKDCLFNMRATASDN